MQTKESVKQCKAEATKSKRRKPKGATRMSESGESDKANLTDQEVGEKLCQDYCATDAPGAKEFRKLAKLGNLLASGALQREDEDKANKKVGG